MFPLPYPCTGELSPYYKSFDKTSVFWLGFSALLPIMVAFLQDFLFFRSLGHGWVLLGGFWGALGASWGTLGALLAALGPLLGPLGALLDASWGVLEASWKKHRKMSRGIPLLEAMLDPKMDAKIDKFRIQKAMRFLSCFLNEF